MFKNAGIEGVGCMRFSFDKFFYFSCIVLITVTVLLVLNLFGEFNPIAAIFKNLGYDVEFVNIGNLVLYNESAGISSLALPDEFSSISTLGSMGRGAL